MEVMAQGNRHIVDSDSKVDNNVVRQKVMDSYQDMLLSLIHISEPTRP